MVVSLLCSACQRDLGREPVVFEGCVHRYHKRCLGDNETKCPWKCAKFVSVIDVLEKLPTSVKQEILMTEAFKSLSPADQVRLKEWAETAPVPDDPVAPIVDDPEAQMNAIDAQIGSDDDDDDDDENERRRQAEHNYD